MFKKFLLLIILASNFLFAQIGNISTEPKSDVYLQGFYWNSPPGGIWYDSLSKIAPRLSSAGLAEYGSVRLRSRCGFSMGTTRTII
jgi:hypothetical protein